MAWAEGKQGDVLAAVIGGGRGGIATVICREDDEVIGTQSGVELREPRVDSFKGARVAFGIVAVAE